jgi:hypothetical protein
VRALSFAPNGGTKSARSHHYRQIRVPDQETARVLASVLSSSTFYFFFKMVSNCRDLGNREWADFPMDPLDSRAWSRLAALGSELESVLRDTASPRTRVYPSGSVRYEEYYPARAKSVLDEIDRVLAGHYSFTSEELEFVIGCDARYRQGRGAQDDDGD